MYLVTLGPYSSPLLYLLVLTNYFSLRSVKSVYRSFSYRYNHFTTVHSFSKNMTTDEFSLPPICMRAPVSSGSKYSQGSITAPASSSQVECSPPVLGTCQKCEQAAKGVGMSIHATLAYSRCRCHRAFQYKLQQYQMSRSRGHRNGEAKPISRPLSCAKRLPTSQRRARLDNESTTLPKLPVQSKTYMVVADLPENYRRQTQLLPSSSLKSLHLQKSVSRLGVDW